MYTRSQTCTFGGVFTVRWYYFLYTYALRCVLSLTRSRRLHRFIRRPILNSSTERESCNVHMVRIGCRPLGLHGVTSSIGMCLIYQCSWMLYSSVGRDEVV